MKPNRREVILAGLLTGCAVPAVVGGAGEEPGELPGETEESFYGQGDTLPGVDEMADDFAADPVILYTSVVVEAGGNGSPDVARLTNPDHLPMELLAVRFRIYPKNVAENDYKAITGMGIGVKMDLGAIPVVDADFPISLFGTVRDSYEFGNEIDSGNHNDVFPMTYEWRLSHPLYIPAGTTLAPAFSHLGQSAFPVNVDVVYIARLATGSKPNVVKVPWVTKYTSKSFTIVEGQPADSDQSSSLDIVNPFAVPLFLNRLVGRVSIFQNESVDAALANLANVVYEDPVQFRNRLCTMTMRSSRGADIIRTPTPIDGVFPANWRAWELPGDWKIQPSEFYNVRLVSSAVTDSFATSAYTSRAQVSIGLVGYREVPRSMVGVMP